jgi:glycosyltransferase involved in cell wall biosynthesis
MKVSLAIISLNEEANILNCIQSASWVDEIVVLDSGSTDKTRELAESVGAKVFTEEWRGFGLQKRRAVELCSNDWILSLDADEALSKPLSEYLQSIFEKTSLVSFAYEFSRVSFYLGRKITHGGWYPDWQLRFFNRKKANWSDSSIHERVQASEVQRVQLDIYHFPFKNIFSQIHTNNRYSSLQADELRANGKSFRRFKLFTKPVSKFLETYLWKRGFLDGLAGFVISVGAAYSVFLKWSKLWEIEHRALWKRREEDLIKSISK